MLDNNPVTPMDPLDERPLRCLVGPTASGKTALALAVASLAGAEVLSLDSMLVYRGMDIGTAKPSSSERARVPHHLIDLVDPSERYDVQRYVADARKALSQVYARGRRALFVGGTGFYLAALLRGLFEGPQVDLELRKSIEARLVREGAEALHGELATHDPESAARIHANDTKRLVRALEVFEQTGETLSALQRQWTGHEPRVDSARLVGLHLERSELDARIGERASAMIAAGWKDEAVRVRSLRGSSVASARASARLRGDARLGRR